MFDFDFASFATGIGTLAGAYAVYQHTQDKPQQVIVTTAPAPPAVQAPAPTVPATPAAPATPTAWSSIPWDKVAIGAAVLVAALIVFKAIK